MEYAVLTTKHHDGFALWPSEYGEFSTKQYMDGRDLVGEFVEACRRQGLKVGFYFSLPDWHHPAFPWVESWDDIPQFMPEFFDADPQQPLEGPDELASFEEYYKYVKGQLRELVTRYGRIDLLWFDLTLWRASLDRRMEGLYELVRAEQPHVVTNDRGYGLGDYQTPENELPDEPMDGWWELCQVWAPPAWAYHEDERYRDLEWTLDRLANTVGRGGNLLLNVGPKASGELPSGAYERMTELKEWASHSGHTVGAVEGGPWPERTDPSVPVTRRSGLWYLHALADAPEKISIRDVPEPADVRLVRTGEALDYEFDGEDGGVGTATVEVPADRRASPDEVVALSWPPSYQHLL
jgi:alpha-L-fucosidase